VVQRSQLQKITHVAPKRLYMVLKKNTVSDDIKKSKSILEEGLQMGKHFIPTKLVKKTSNSVQNQVVFHEVLQKETKYSIAKKYDISIDELEKKKS
jgi:hypothetical protein